MNNRQQETDDLLIEPSKKFVIDVGWVLVSSVVTLLIGFLVKPLLSRWLGASGLGLYSLSLTFYAITLLIANLGIAESLVKYTAEDKDNINKTSQTVFSGLTITVILSIIIAGILYILGTPIANLFNIPELTHLIPLIALSIPFSSIFLSINGFFNGLRQMKTYGLLLATQSLFRTALILILVKVGLDIKGAIIGLVVAEIGVCLTALILSRNFFRLHFQNYFRNIKKFVFFGGQMFAANAINIIVNQTDIMMIGYFLVAADVGYYSAAVFVFTFFGIIPGAIQKITFPAASKFWSEHNYAELHRMIDKSMKYTACILIPLGLAVGFFAKDILRLIFGAEFIVAALPLIVLLIARVIRGSTIVPIGNIIPGIGRPDVNLKIGIVIAVVNVGLNILLIPYFGILGAAIATTTSLLIGSIVFYVFAIKLLKVTIDIKWHVRIFSMALLAGLLFWGLSGLLNHYLIGGIILAICVIFILKFFISREDRASVISLVRSFVIRK